MNINPLILSALFGMMLRAYYMRAKSTKLSVLTQKTVKCLK